MKKVIIDNKAVPVADTRSVFGIGSITRPTPEIATYVFRAVLYLALSAVLITQTVTEIPPAVSAAIGKYALEAVALVHGLTKLWGLKEVK